MKRIELLNIYNVVAGLKIGNVSPECAYALVKVKIGISEPVKKMEENQKVVIQELKPEGFDEKNKEMVAGLNQKIGEFMEKYMEEDVDISLPKITEEDVYVLGKSNDLSVAQLEVLIKLTNF